MSHHMSTGGHLVDADSIQALDDAVKIAGALAFILGVIVSIRAGFRKWWHRRRDRQEKLVRDLVDDIRTELAAHSTAVAHQLNDIDTKVDGVAADVTTFGAQLSEIRTNQIGHVTDHATGKFRTA